MMSKHKRDNFRIFGWIFVLIGLVYATLAFQTSLQDIPKYQGGDLMCRVIGSLALFRGFDPYFMTPEQNAILPIQDKDRHPQITCCTYLPGLLVIYSATSKLDYFAQRWAWFYIEWALLLVTLWFSSRLVPGRTAKEWFLAAGLLFFASAVFWRLHVERGQSYVLFAVLTVLSLYAALRLRRARWLSGVFMGINLTLRPTELFTFLPRAISLRPRGLVDAILPGVIALVLMIALIAEFKFSTFRNFVTMAKTYQLAALTGVIEVDQSKVDPGRPPNISKKKPKKMRPSLDRYLQSELLKVREGGTTLTGSIQRWVYKKKFLTKEEALHLIRINSMVTLGYVGLVGGLLALSALMGVCGSARWQLAVGLLVSTMLGHFAPIRWEYADVTYLPLLALLSPWLLRINRAPYAIASTLILGGLILGIHPSDLTERWPAYARAGGILLGAHIALVAGYLEFRQGRRKRQLTDLLPGKPRNPLPPPPERSPAPTAAQA
jgi:hypothetical protein